MRFLKSLLFFLLFFWLPLKAEEAPLPYSVRFVGVDDPALIKTLKAASDLYAFKKKPLSSLNALRYRADSDIPGLLKVLHAYGFYEATVEMRLEDFGGRTEVFVMIQLGPLYTLETYKIELKCESPSAPCPSLDLTQLGLKEGESARAEPLLQAEQKALLLLSDAGYPLAKVLKRDMVVDGKTKTLRVHLEMGTGPFTKFGKSNIQGLTEVKPQLVERKIAWKEGDEYQGSLVEKTQASLMETGLFTSVLISHPSDLTDAGRMPLKIEVAENKHKSVNMGVSYQTFYGPGITFGWENRNVGGMGRKFTLQGDITKKTHTGMANFLVPGFFRNDQDYVANAQAMYESIYTYNQQSYSITNRVERRIGVQYRISGGVKLEREIVTHSVDNGTFTLLEIPVYFRWSSADNLLNPTKGATLEYRLTPSTNFSALQHYYLPQSLSYMLYTSLTRKDNFLIAQQLTVESILSNTLDSIPVPKRVLGGSEQDLRGYRYKTVSPLRGDKPIGGRSGIFYTFEARFRVSRTIGIVPFFDMGAVYLTEIPQIKGKWYKSVGLGIRYFTFLGPIRFDVAFPLDKRDGIDSTYRVLASIGQTF